MKTTKLLVAGLMGIAVFGPSLNSFAACEKIGVEIYAGGFTPFNKETRKQFGSFWPNYGATPCISSGGSCALKMKDADECGDRKASIYPSLGFVWRNHHCNRLFVVKPSVGASLPLADSDQDVIPYVAATVGPAWFNYRFNRDGKRVKGSKFGVTGGVELGVHIKKFRVYGQVDFYSRPHGLKLDGASLNVAYAIL